MKIAKLMFSSSDVDPDVLYFTKIFVPDAFIALELDNKKIAVVNKLEFNRFKETSAVDEVLSLEQLLAEAREHYNIKKAGYIEAIKLLAERYQISEFSVPSLFPTGLAFDLVDAGLKLVPVKTKMFFDKERACKTAEEAEYLRQGNAASANGILAAEQALRSACVQNDGTLQLDGEPLTSDLLRQIVGVACLKKGAVALNTICAGGSDGVDPHNAGSGVLRANELIVVDVFPRLEANGYYGDMTRTFLRGTPSDDQKRLVTAVRDAQLQSMHEIKAGVSGRVPYDKAMQVLEGHGFITEEANGLWQGFIHGLGHGFGVDLHEEPYRMSTSDILLNEGLAVTVEPGLYYPHIGGCRIEDSVWVKKDGFEMLSDLHYDWVIE